MSNTSQAVVSATSLAPVNLDTLIAFASAGWKFFPGIADPEKPGKYKPACSWPTFATSDESALRACHSQGFPVFGAVMGHGIAALDIDEKAGKPSGSVTLAALGVVLPTDQFGYSTPNGGRHLFFAVPAGQRAPTDTNAIGPSVDRRGDGGFVWFWLLNGFAATGQNLAPAPEWMTASPRAANDPSSAKAPRGLSIDALRALLHRLDPVQHSNRTAWTNLGMAIHHETRGSDEGLDLFDEFSRRPGAGKYEGRRDVEAQWRSYEWKDPNAITVATYADREAHAWLAAQIDTRTLGFGGAEPSTPPPPTTSLQLTQAGDIQMIPIRWVWPGFLARGKFHLVAGRPDAGKTTVTLEMIAIASRGGTFADGNRCETPLHSFIWSSEDDRADTLVPRLKAMGADLTRVHFIDQMTQNGVVRPFDPATDMQHLYNALNPYKGQIGILMIDPVVVLASGDGHKNAEVRKDLGALVTLTELLDCVTVGITHFTKGTRGQDPVERVTGSLAFAAVARLVLAVAKRREDDGGGSAFVRAKGNIVQSDADIPRGFVFHTRNTDLGQGINASRVEWGEQLDGTAAEVLEECEARDGTDGKLDQAAEWLREYLAPGAAFATELYDDAKAAGHTEITIKRAKRDAKVKTHLVAGRWHWFIEGKGSTVADVPPAAGIEYTPTGTDDPRIVARDRMMARARAAFGTASQ